MTTDTNSSSSSPTSSAFGRLCRKLSSRKALAEESPSNQQLRRVFNYFDENGDGKISPAELQSCVIATGGQLSIEEAEAAVKSSDVDGDGLLGLDEFQKLMETSEEEEKSKELRVAFGMYEMDGSGCITPSSLRKMLARLGDSHSVDDCKAMIRNFDLNGDGVLTFDEFALMMR